MTLAEILAYHEQHTRQRYRERWGKKLSKAGYAALCRAVGDPGVSTYLRDGSNDRVIFVVRFRGDDLRVVVDLQLEVVVTVLPKPDHLVPLEERPYPTGDRPPWYYRRSNLA